MKANEIKGKGPVDEITVKIVSKDEPREVRGGSLKVCNCVGEDDTGKVGITLWSDDIEKYAEGDTIKITKGWANDYNNEVTVSSGKFGQIEKVE